ncbi:MAG: acetate kinase [Snowella sp.]|nr:acetate kinase [Snowella sp.]
MKILVLNAGSSSQKSCLYDLPDDRLPSQAPEPRWDAMIDWTVAEGQGLLTVKANGIKQKIELASSDRREGIRQMLQSLYMGETAVLQNLAEIDCVGHRVVHGGTDYSQATLITPDVKNTIQRLIPLAPAHNPAHLEGIDAIEQSLGDIPQIAVFDTAFHTTIPPKAAFYPIPYEWIAKGIRRYGFHGTSHQFCAHRAAEILNKPLADLKMITCHIGNGASLTAIQNGLSIDTTMGFTPLEGLMMGARSGSIDPAILIYLMQEYGLTAEQLNYVLNKESGLKGISGLSADLRSILQAIQEGNQRAELAFAMYIHRFRACLGQMIASLEGLEVLVFTAGVGENSAIVREKVCEGFAFLGLYLDLEKNQQSLRDQDLSTPNSSVRIFIIHTEEDWAIAQECWRFHH